MRTKKSKKTPQGRGDSIKVASTMGQAVALTGLTLAVLKEAKRLGCPAFRGSRVHIEDLKQWLLANPPAKEGEGDGELPSKQHLERLRLRAQVRLLTFKAEQEMNEWVKKSELAMTIPKLLQRTIDTLAKHLPTAQFNAICHELKRAAAQITK